jgi:hypothetical protein
MKLADQADRRYPPEVGTLVHRAASFLAHTVRPDGFHPWMGNGRRGSALDPVALAIEGIDNPELEWIVSGGTRGVRPEVTTHRFPWAGYTIMRSHWNADANYALFDAGPLGIQHAHEDKLSVEIAAYGRSIIEDPGIHTYSTAEHTIPLRNYFCNTWGHSTVIVDGKSQIRQIRKLDVRTDRPDEHTARSTNLYDYCSGSYDSGWGMNAWRSNPPSPYPVLSLEGEIDDSVVHHRSILFVRASHPEDPEY